MTHVQFTGPSSPFHGQLEQAAGPILVVTRVKGDWSSVADAARLLADRDGCRVQVVGVLEPLIVYGSAPGFHPPTIVLEEERKAALLSALQERLRRTAHDADRWSTEVAYGPPAITVAALARERQARLMIVGVGPHAPVGRLFGGQITLHTLQVANCPVLVVPAAFAGLPRRAVVGIDFSPNSVWAAERALRLVDDQAVVTLLHVTSHAELTEPQWATRATSSERCASDILERLRLTLPVPDGVRLELVERTGDPADEILAHVKANGADLVALGSQGAGFLGHTVVGSVARAVLEQSACAVLACPRPPAADVERIERALAGSMVAAASNN